MKTFIQCPAVHPTKGGAVFCTKEAGHEDRGDPEHRGYRKRWTGKAPGNAGRLASHPRPPPPHPLGQDGECECCLRAECSRCGEIVRVVADKLGAIVPAMREEVQVALVTLNAPTVAS